jgi:UPF0716 family protein affecting phage T7 exclusion
MDETDRNVTVTDIRIPFWRLVAFFVKATLAAIPATIFLMIIFAILGAVFAYVLGGDWSIMMQRWKV